MKIPDQQPVFSITYKTPVPEAEPVGENSSTKSEEAERARKYLVES
jgi:hypothetical protein